jgi:hypothetical protein
MKIATVLLAFILGLVSLEAVATPTRVFKGAWFSVAYPADFIAEGSMRSATADGFDSAYFRDRKGRVEFYVFSPQAGGEPTDLENALTNQKLIKDSVTESAGRSVRSATYAAPGKAIFRSIEEVRTKDLLQIRVFAIKYRTAADLTANLAAYQRFKKSFEAFAD